MRVLSLGQGGALLFSGELIVVYLYALGRQRAYLNGGLFVLLGEDVSSYLDVGRAGLTVVAYDFLGPTTKSWSLGFSSMASALVFGRYLARSALTWS